jgi:hypothetical protein
MKETAEIDKVEKLKVKSPKSYLMTDVKATFESVVSDLREKTIAKNWPLKQNNT